jgi:hypothetical protein
MRVAFERGQEATIAAVPKVPVEFNEYPLQEPAGKPF